MRRDLITLAAVMSIAWAGIWGYIAYRDNSLYAFNRDYTAAVDATPGADRRPYMRAAELRDEFHRARNNDLAWLAGGLAAILAAASAALWITRSRLRTNSP